VAGQADFNNYGQYFVNTMRSFRQLTDQAKLNKKAERIRIKTVRQSSTLEQALKTLGMPDKRLEELAILNGMRSTDRVSQGSLIKVIDK
jgi:predicted Zn-dependent protease